MTAAQIGGAVVQQGYGSLAPFIVEYFRINKAALGASFTLIMLGSAFTVALGGMAVDRFGERTMTIFAGVGIFLTLTMAALMSTYGAMIAWLFIMGLTYGAMTPAGGRAILTWFTRDRGFAMSIRQMGVPIGAMVGGVMLPLLATHWNYRAALFGGAILALVLTAGAATLYHDASEDAFPAPRFHQVFGGIRSIVLDPRMLCLATTCALLAIAQQTMVGFLALTAVNRAHVSITLAAGVFIVAQAASMMGRLVWGRASDVIFGGDRVMPIALSCGLLVFAAAGLAITAPGATLVLFASALLYGFTGAGWNGLFAAAMAEIGGARLAGSAIGIGLTAVFFAGAAGPLAFGAFADAYGLSSAWWLIAVLAAIGVFPAVLARRAFAAAELRERASLG
ncbi:MAG TPA: MFS transporter [Candidatus Baltobacteraceae bacterium]|jgi:MFS family permease